MKVILLVSESCNCTDRLWKFRNTFNMSNDREMLPGTKVECDCGTVWELVYDGTFDRLRWT